MTDEELDRWLVACLADPSIVGPWEMGYLPDGTHRSDHIPSVTNPTVSTDERT